MAKVSFRTKSGERVSFTSKKRRTPTSELTPYQRHMRREIPKIQEKSGVSAKTAMKRAAKSWNKKK
jgi:hypothetical protein